MNSNDVSCLIKAIKFATDAHNKQKRKGTGDPYIIHPIRVMLLLTECNIYDYTALSAAVLHDTVEDTGTTIEKITEEFGSDIAQLVKECTDDKSQSKVNCKKEQLARISTMSDFAKMIKIADKIDNLSDVEINPPPSWTSEYTLGYVTWSYAIWLKARNLNSELDNRISSIFAKYNVLDIPEDELNSRLEKWYESMQLMI